MTATEYQHWLVRVFGKEKSDNSWWSTAISLTNQKKVSQWPKSAVMLMSSSFLGGALLSYSRWTSASTSPSKKARGRAGRAGYVRAERRQRWVI